MITLLPVRLRQLDVEVTIVDSRRGDSSGADHELLVLPLQHNGGVVLAALLLYHMSDEIPFLGLEGLLDLALGNDQTVVVFLVDDGEV